MRSFEEYRKLIEEEIEQELYPANPAGLYEPISYFLALGGKRMRPALLLLAAEMYDASLESAMNAALSIEYFHNFTLVHDDIMDQAELRRGKSTVHKKWNENTGILSGDAVLVKAYQRLQSYSGTTLNDLLKVFNDCAIWVCEGQQYDMDFENRDDVFLDEYLEMIRLKTAVLLGGSLKMGGIVAGVSGEEQEKLFRIGESLGIAFQLQDDYLDIYGDQAKFGKSGGGDIEANKKTFFYLQAMELANEEQKSKLKSLYAQQEGGQDKIDAVTNLFTDLELGDLARNRMQMYFEQASTTLQKLDCSEGQKQPLLNLASQLLVREY